MKDEQAIYSKNQKQRMKVVKDTLLEKFIIVIIIIMLTEILQIYYTATVCFK